MQLWQVTVVMIQVESEKLKRMILASRQTSERIRVAEVTLFVSHNRSQSRFWTILTECGERMMFGRESESERVYDARKD